MARYSKIVDVYGDKLRITWNGNAWISPHNGQQHGRADHAMRSELEEYYRSCDIDVEHEETIEEIDVHLAQMTDED